MIKSEQKICAACAEVAILPGHNEPHELMSVESRQANSQGGYDCFYRCLECDSVLVGHTDSSGSSTGYKLFPTDG